MQMRMHLQHHYAWKVCNYRTQKDTFSTSHFNFVVQAVSGPDATCSLEIFCQHRGKYQLEIEEITIRELPVLGGMKAWMGCWDVYISFVFVFTSIFLLKISMKKFSIVNFFMKKSQQCILCRGQKTYTLYFAIINIFYNELIK